MATLTAAWCLVPTPSFAQDSDKADELARTLIAQGQEAFKVGRWSEAEAAYQAAWDIKPGYDVGANLGDAEFRLGQYHEAAQHLAYAHKHYPVTAQLKKKAAIQKLLDEARAKVGEVNVTVNIDKAQVFVDKVLVGVAPLELPLFVTPGNHTIEAKRDRYIPATQSITATAGSTQNAALVLDLVPSAKPDGNEVGGNGAGTTGGVVAPPGGNVVTPRTVDRNAAPDPAWMAVTGGLAAVGIGLGIGFTVAANGKADDAVALQQPGGSSACLGSMASACADLFAAREDQSALANAALVSWLVGGAFALGTAGLAVWTWTGSGSSRQSAVHMEPAISTTHGGVSVRGLW